MEGVIFKGQRRIVPRYCGTHGTGVLCRYVLHRHRDVAEGGKWPVWQQVTALQF